MRTTPISRILKGAALFGICLFLAGCSSPPPARPPGNAEFTKLARYWQPYQLYILAAPHPRLYVEIDAVEGCVPGEADLNTLSEFLAAYCDKPGGIELVRSDVIPKKAARGIPPRALARKFLNGPTGDTNGPPPAFAYVLFYDGRLANDSAAAKTKWHALANPHTDLLPYPTIYINTRYGPKSMRPLSLRHEAGHLLGLASRSAFAADFHCTDADCLMNKAIRIHLGRVILGLGPNSQLGLCERCRGELRERSGQSPPSNLRFSGPVLVRSEAGYQVLSLPDRVRLIAGDFTEQDCRDFAAEVRAEEAVPGSDDDELGTTALVRDSVVRDPAGIEILNRAKADPNESVSKIAQKSWFRAVAGQYWVAGQFTKVVEVCRQAVLRDAKDEWSYQAIAWIKATCPDATVRDGREAVSAATKACELTKWKDRGVIECLAAAWAEAGDFPRAIEFEERAMRTGDPAELDRKAMRERIALYQQSRPFRDQSRTNH